MACHDHLIDRYYLLSSFVKTKINGDRKFQDLHLSTCIQLRMTKHPPQKVKIFRYLLSCDTIVLINISYSLKGRVGQNEYGGEKS